MKCDAASIRRSAASHNSRARATIPVLGGDARECVEGEDLNGRVVVAASVVEDRRESLLRAGDSVLGVERRQQALAECGLLTASGSAVPRGRGLERRPGRRRPSQSPQHAPAWTRASAARRRSPVASAFSIARLSVAAPVS